MSELKSYKINRGGAYVVKAAESPSRHVRPKRRGPVTHTVSDSDRRLAQDVIRHKSRNAADLR